MCFGHLPRLVAVLYSNCPASGLTPTLGVSEYGTRRDEANE